MRERRRKGDGSVRLRSDGRYEGRITIGHRLFTVYGRDRATIESKLAEISKEGEQRKKPRPETVATLLSRWLASRRGLKPSALRRYESDIRNYLVPHLGRIRLDRLNADAVQGLIDAMNAAGKAARSIKNTRATLRVALEWAIARQLINLNVAKLVELPRISRARIPPPLTADESRKLVLAMIDHRFGALYVLTLTTGLRQGEVLGVPVEGAIDLEAATLCITQQLYRETAPNRGGKFILLEPKTVDSEDTIALPEVAVAALRHQLRQRAEDKKAASLAWEDSGLLFTTPIGRPLNGSYVTKQFQRLLMDLELPRQRFHDLRHTCCSLLLANGASLYDVKNAARHSQIAITADLYGHPYDEGRRATARRMDDIMHAAVLQVAARRVGQLPLFAEN